MKDKEIKRSDFVEVFATSWIEIHRLCPPQYAACVEVFATSWIEIAALGAIGTALGVEVFATSWIEIPYTTEKSYLKKSRSLRPRGLKFLFIVIRCHETSGRGLCDLVD